MFMKYLRGLYFYSFWGYWILIWYNITNPMFKLSALEIDIDSTEHSKCLHRMWKINVNITQVTLSHQFLETGMSSFPRMDPLY